jgi:hypothetical protein
MKTFRFASVGLFNITSCLRNRSFLQGKGQKNGQKTELIKINTPNALFN